MIPAASPYLSIVVIGRNEGERLLRCLESLRPLTAAFETVEVIYVDSDSRDASPDRAAEWGATVLSVHPEQPCAAIGRNAGWRAARAPMILFLDGDTLLESGFVERGLDSFRDPAVAVVWGHRRESHPERSLYNRVLDLDWIYPAGPSDFCGGDALIRRSVLEEVGGFEEDLIAGEEPDLCHRIRSRGYVILHIDQPMTLHDLDITCWPAYWRRAVRAGYAYAEVSQRLKHSGFPLWLRDARRNWIMSCVFTLMAVSAVVTGVFTGSAWPVALLFLLFLLLSLRSAYKARWKSGNRWTLVCYGIHSHLQQIPITVGQIRYWRDRFRGRHGLLIEYK